MYKPKIAVPDAYSEITAAMLFQYLGALFSTLRNSFLVSDGWAGVSCDAGAGWFNY